MGVCIYNKLLGKLNVGEPWTHFERHFLLAEVLGGKLAQVLLPAGESGWPVGKAFSLWQHHHVGVRRCGSN